MAIFFRDPVRVVPTAPGLVVSPADGRVEPIVRAAPPPELGLGEKRLTRVSIFMNVFDCHINRAPVAGRVARIAYKPGKFLSADLDKASEDNERNSIVDRDGIAGTTSAWCRSPGWWRGASSAGRREGAAVERGRADRHDPLRLAARRLSAGRIDSRRSSAGQRAIAGETLIAVLPGAELAPPFPTRRD